MLNNFEEIILNGHDRKGEPQDSESFIYSTESLPENLLKVPYELRTLGPRRFWVNTKKKTKINNKDYNLIEIWPTSSAGKILAIVPFYNGKPPNSTLEFHLGENIRLFNSDYRQLNFVYPPDGNNFYSIHFFPEGKIEKLKETLKNINNLEELL